MNLNPLYELLDANDAPAHAKVVLLKLLSCQGNLRVTSEHFGTDRDLQALKSLGLITYKVVSRRLKATKKAYQLAEMAPR